MEKRDLKQIGLGVAAIAVSLALVYKYKFNSKTKRVKKISYAEFKKQNNPSGAFLITDVPGAIVFDPSNERTSSFTFGERKI